MVNLYFLLIFLDPGNVLILCEGLESNPTIELRLDYHSPILSSVERLQFYYKEVTGWELLVQTGPNQPKPSKYKIVFKFRPCDKHPIHLTPCSAFTIDVRDDGEIHFSAHSPQAIDYAVSEFIERFLGVRWLMPTQLGTHIPKKKRIIVPIGSFDMDSPFWGRTLKGMDHPELERWAKNLRASPLIHFRHNLNSLFPPEDYISDHSDIFPIEEGVRRIPANNSIYRWQPCFSNPKVTEAAIQQINAFFENHPEESSFSLGINDSDRFCHCEKCASKYPKKKNNYGYLNTSEVYFHWVNQVAEGVYSKHPDKWFGLLAYLNCGEPPEKFDLHPHVIPFLTYDRAKWILPKIQKTGQRITRDFLKKSNYIGWYDYFLGSPYLLPRVYFKQMACNFRWAANQQRIKYVFGGGNPNFGEGPKHYIAFKLLWNPWSNVDNLLKEWIELAVGHEAAPDLLAYFLHWESFWTQRIKKSDWLTEKGQWMWFGEPDYLKLVTEEEIQFCRGQLERVCSKAKTIKQKARAEMLLKAFEYFEASAYSYWFYVEKRPGLKEPASFFELMDKKRYTLVQIFDSDLLLQHQIRFDQKNIVNLELLNWKSE